MVGRCWWGWAWVPPTPEYKQQTTYWQSTSTKHGNRLGGDRIRVASRIDNNRVGYQVNQYLRRTSGSNRQASYPLEAHVALYHRGSWVKEARWVFSDGTTGEKIPMATRTGMMSNVFCCLFLFWFCWSVPIFSPQKN